MKEKMTYLILGILIGAVITAGCFLVFAKNQEPGKMMGERPEGFENMVEGGRRGGRGDETFVPQEMQDENFVPNEEANPDKTTKNTVAE